MTDKVAPEVIGRILELMETHTNREIGEIIGKSGWAVSQIIHRRILPALGADGKTQAVGMAIRRGIIK